MPENTSQKCMKSVPRLPKYMKNNPHKGIHKGGGRPKAAHPLCEGRPEAASFIYMGVVLIASYLKWPPCAENFFPLRRACANLAQYWVFNN